MTAEVTALAPRPTVSADTLREIILGNDLGRLTDDQRVEYVLALCAHVGVSPLGEPFKIITKDGRTFCHATKDCGAQLRAIHRISIEITGRERTEDVYIVTAKATNAKGRTDESIGVTMIQGTVGVELANALMGAETRAKRRVTLSICGLGMLDESEISGVVPAAPREEFMPGELPRLKPPERPEVIPPKRERVTSGAAEIKHDGHPCTTEQFTAIRRLQEKCGGKWCTTESDARSGWRKVLGVYRDKAGERITGADDLSSAQAEHLIKRMEEYHAKRTANIRPIDIGHIPEPKIDKESIAELRSEINHNGFHEGAWLFGLFGADKAEELTLAQAGVALELLLAKHKDDDSYHLALEKAIRAGFVHDSRGVTT